MRKILISLFLILALATSACAYFSHGDTCFPGVRYRHLEVEKNGRITFELVNENKTFVRLSASVLFCKRSGDVLADAFFSCIDIPPDAKMEIETWVLNGTVKGALDASKIVWVRY